MFEKEFKGLIDIIHKMGLAMILNYCSILFVYLFSNSLFCIYNLGSMFQLKAH